MVALRQICEHDPLKYALLIFERYLIDIFLESAHALFRVLYHTILALDTL